MKIPLKHSSFSLDVSGIAGFFGGEESLAAMSSVHLIRGRRWLGWYNSPGSLYDGLFPSANVDPSSLLELDGKHGPRYLGVYSEISLTQTGHLAYLLADYCDKLRPNSHSCTQGLPPSAKGLPVMVVNFQHDAKIELNVNLPSDYFFDSDFDPFVIVPIIVSVATAMLCGLTRDWYSFAMISGEHVVSYLVRGRYNLYYKSEDRYHDIGYSSLALTIQFLAQLFLILQGELFGQIMFLASLGVSWIFKSYLAFVDRDQLQMRMLLKILKQPAFSDKIYLPKWTAVVAFAAFSFNADNLIPNNTAVWRIWKGRVVEAVATCTDPNLVWEELEAQLDAAGHKLLADLLDQASLGYNAARRIE
ncbi:hypothetical protein BDZ97DRAFT_1906648 [Flammula alnicola]|nr:hypothetical protein BDZ97DRAFT_1906648 [Flammula alnicola]